MKTSLDRATIRPFTRQEFIDSGKKENEPCPTTMELVVRGVREGVKTGQRPDFNTLFCEMTEENQRNNQVAEGLEIKTGQGRRLLELAHENIQLADRKQQDYGPKNILYSGELGIIVRCQDKLCRLKHLLEKNDGVMNESIEDSYRDLANYALIGILLRRGEWEDKERV